MSDNWRQNIKAVLIKHSYQKTGDMMTWNSLCPTTEAKEAEREKSIEFSDIHSNASRRNDREINPAASLSNLQHH